MTTPDSDTPAAATQADAARHPYGAQHARRNLAEVLPLSTPFSLHIDPSNACNFRCIFCPTGNPAQLQEAGRPKGVMPFDLFRKIVDDLAAFPQPLKTIHLYKDGEPLINKKFPQMVRLIKERGVARTVETTTNGALLTPPLADALIEAGLDAVRVSVYAADDRGYETVTQTNASYRQILDNVRHLSERKKAVNAPLHIHCKIVNVSLSDELRETFLQDFSPISDSVYVHPRHGDALTVEGFQKQPDRLRKVCSEPFLKMVINFNGKVSVCCADWMMQTIIGDVREQSLPALWRSDALREFRIKHLTGRKDEISACRGCDYMQTLPQDNNLDAFAETLAQRL